MSFICKIGAAVLAAILMVLYSTVTFGKEHIVPDSDVSPPEKR